MDNTQQETASQNEKFLTEKELLARLKICRRSLHNWERAGKIPVIKISRSKRYLWQNVKAALLRLERNGVAP